MNCFSVMYCFADIRTLPIVKFLTLIASSTRHVGPPELLQVLMKLTIKLLRSFAQFFLESVLESSRSDERPIHREFSLCVI